MFRTASQNGFSLKVYQGSMMSLLTMNMSERPAEGSFAGFTIFYTSPNGKRNPISNLLNFKGTDTITGSDVSPLQVFKWVHFPGSYHDTGMLQGDYVYEATPRYFDNDKNLLPLDDSTTAKVNIKMGDFSDGKLRVGFTRAFLKSQAFTNRYGSKQRLTPDVDDWMFDTKQKAGHNTKYGDFTYEDMYAWLGFNARKMVYELLEEALQNSDVTVDMFAYDFNDPVVASLCLELAAKGRIRIILDNAFLHHNNSTNGKLTEEDDFENRFNNQKKQGAELFRCRFGRYSHCKEIILRKKGKAYKVMTGSTNFSVTGFYINANHILVFDNSSIAGYYGDIFDACWQNGSAASFRKTSFASTQKNFLNNNFPRTEINVSPHDKTYAQQVLDAITANVKSSRIRSVLFSVMEMGTNSTGSLISTLRELHKDDSIYTYGVTDNSSGDISLYKPGRKNGLLIDAQSAARELPPPFKTEHSLSKAHAIHHKFVVTNFNQPSARVYCGSSNLALGGEKENGNNLLCIKDTDVATVFAIEALRLTDHYNFRSVKEEAEKQKAGLIAKSSTHPARLDNTGKWVNKYYDENDIRYVERNLFA